MLVSCAVTTIEIVFTPTLKLMSLDAVPDTTLTAFTVTREVLSNTVGVTVNVVVAFDTDAAYAVVDDTNTGDKVPLLIVRFDKSLLFDNTLVAVCN